MTRGNINYIGDWKQGTTPDERYPDMLYFYHNGDQYPQGIRDYHNLFDFLNSDMKTQDFKDWALKNYEDVEIEEIDQPRIYYTGIFITDYSYVFDMSMGKVVVYNYASLIFDGDVSEFKEWLSKQK